MTNLQRRIVNRTEFGTMLTISKYNLTQVTARNIEESSLQIIVAPGSNLILDISKDSSTMKKFYCGPLHHSSFGVQIDLLSAPWNN